MSRIYVIEGHPLLCERRLQELSTRLMPTERSVDTARFRGGEAKVSDIVDFSTALPYSEHRLVMIRDLYSLPKKDLSLVAGAWSRVSSVKVIATVNPNKTHKGQEKASVEAESRVLLKEILGNELKSVKVNSPYLGMTRKGMRIWIRQFLSGLNLEIDPEALHMLSDTFREDPDALVGTILCMSDMVLARGSFLKEPGQKQDQHTIYPSDILGLIGEGPTSIYSLLEALAEGDMEKSRQIVSHLSRMSVRVEEVLSVLGHDLRSLIVYHEVSRLDSVREGGLSPEAWGLAYPVYKRVRELSSRVSLSDSLRLYLWLCDGQIRDWADLVPVILKMCGGSVRRAA